MKKLCLIFISILFLNHSAFAVVKIDIVADDYEAKVATLLADHRKKANVPGFRKGQVPMGMIKKQHGKSILMEEVNKLLQESLNTFLAEEKLDLLGNPLPRVQEDFNWDSETLSFEFESTSPLMIEVGPLAEAKLYYMDASNI